jgi:hypothetical protein
MQEKISNKLSIQIRLKLAKAAQQVHFKNIKVFLLGFYE